MIVCPQGVPQAACDAANALIASSPPPQGWDPSSILSTFKQWWASANPASPQPPIDPGSYIPGQPAANILLAATNFWTQFAAQNPGAIGNINPGCWGLPWQFVPQGSSDPVQAIVSAMSTMLASPNTAQWLQHGQLPPLDPTTVNWGALGNPTTFAQLANGVAQYMPALQQFVQQGAVQGEFRKPTNTVSTDLRQTLTPNTPPPPNPNITPVTIIAGTPPNLTNTWLLAGLAIGGAALVGLVAYGVYHKKQHQLHENPVDYAGFRAAVTNQLEHRYKVPYRDAVALLDTSIPHSKGEPSARYFFDHNINASRASHMLYAFYVAGGGPRLSAGGRQ